MRKKMCSLFFLKKKTAVNTGIEFLCSRSAAWRSTGFQQFELRCDFSSWKNPPGCIFLQDIQVVPSIDACSRQDDAWEATFRGGIQSTNQNNTTMLLVTLYRKTNCFSPSCPHATTQLEHLPLRLQVKITPSRGHLHDVSSPTLRSRISTAR